MTPVRINRLSSAVKRASNPRPKNHLYSIRGNHLVQRQAPDSECIRKARAKLYRDWAKLPQHKKTKRRWRRIVSHLDVRAQYSAVSATDNFTGTYNNFYDSQFLDVRAQYSAISATDNFIGSIYGYYDSEFLDGIDDSAQPGVGIAAINMSYQCLPGVGQYIAWQATARR